MKHYFDTFPTLLGDFSVAVDPDGSLVATAFGGEAALRRRFHFDHLIRDSGLVAGPRREIEEYCAGERRDFTVRLAAAGTAFQHTVWSALCGIPFGETRSYGQIASLLGRPGAARAIGRANATNPICLVVPCHRVIGADGSLTGFAFGEAIKRRLLTLEQRR
jgi:methylated-DNA-[protein]-cysteine S-methyltransferase